MVETRAKQAATAAGNSDDHHDPVPAQSPTGPKAVNIHSISLKKVDSDEANQQLIQEQESANQEPESEQKGTGSKAKRSRRNNQYGARKRAAREQAMKAEDALPATSSEQGADV